MALEDQGRVRALIRFLELSSSGGRGEFSSYVLLADAPDGGAVVQVNLANGSATLSLPEPFHLGEEGAVVSAEALLKALKALVKRLPCSVELAADGLRLEPRLSPALSYKLAVLNRSDYPYPQPALTRARAEREWGRQTLEALLEHLRPLRGFSDREDAYVSVELAGGQLRLMAPGDYRMAFASCGLPGAAHEAPLKFSLNKGQAERLVRWLPEVQDLGLSLEAQRLEMQGTVSGLRCCQSFQRFALEEDWEGYANLLSVGSSCQVSGPTLSEAIEAGEAVMGAKDKACKLALTGGLLQVNFYSAERGEYSTSLEASGIEGSWPPLSLEHRPLKQALVALGEASGQVTIGYVSEVGAVKVGNGSLWYVISAHEV